MIHPAVGEMYALTDECHVRLVSESSKTYIVTLDAGTRVLSLKRPQWFSANISTARVEVLTQCGRRAIVPVRRLT